MTEVEQENQQLHHRLSEKQFVEKYGDRSELMQESVDEIKSKKMDAANRDEDQATSTKEMEEYRQFKEWQKSQSDGALTELEK